MFEVIGTSAVDHEGIHHNDQPTLVYTPTGKVLDLPYLFSCSQEKYNTSWTYLHRLKNFMVYLLKRPEEPFDIDLALEFWSYVEPGDIKKWQIHRYDQRRFNKKMADWPTITLEAETVYLFMHFASGYGTRMLHVPTTCMKSVRSGAAGGMLEGIKASHVLKEVVDYAPIKIAKPKFENDYEIDDLEFEEDEVKLPNDFRYLPAHQIGLAIELFPDRVYEWISAAALHTGLRPFELLSMPTITPGRHFVCDPAMLRNKIRRGEEEMIFKVTDGKGGKPREIPIDLKVWLDIMERWWPELQRRIKRYKETEGKDMPFPRTLWINAELQPLYCDPDNPKSHKKPLAALSKAFQYVSSLKKDCCTMRDYGFRFYYYKLRRTFATLYFYEIMSRTDNFDGQHWWSNTTHTEDLRVRMGHKRIGTTIKHYIDNALDIHRRSQEGDGRWSLDPMRYLDEHRWSKE